MKWHLSDLVFSVIITINIVIKKGKEHFSIDSTEIVSKSFTFV